jgi:CheY-like chemotaxis protein
MLAARGYLVQEARRPGEALQLVDAGREFDLLVTDVILPQMTGLELARRLAAQSPELHVVYTSGYASGSIMAPGAVVAGSAFLTKPFLSSQLVQAAETALGLAATAA